MFREQGAVFFDYNLPLFPVNINKDRDLGPVAGILVAAADARGTVGVGDIIIKQEDKSQKREDKNDNAAHRLTS